MKRDTDPRSAGGFTLLEIVVAIAIFGVCISLVYTLYNSVTSVAQSVEEQSDRDLSAQIALDRIAADLAFVHVDKAGYVAIREGTGLISEDPIVDVITTAHLNLDLEAAPVDVSRVRYYLKDNDGLESFMLLRSDTPMATGNFEEALSERPKHLLSAEVTAFEIICIGQDGEEYDEWNSLEDFTEDQEVRDTFPRAYVVELSLGSGRDGDEVVSTYRTRVKGSTTLIEFEGE